MFPVEAPWKPSLGGFGSPGLCKFLRKVLESERCRGMGGVVEKGKAMIKGVGGTV